MTDEKLNETIKNTLLVQFAQNHQKNVKVQFNPKNYHRKFQTNHSNKQPNHTLITHYLVVHGCVLRKLATVYTRVPALRLVEELLVTTGTFEPRLKHPAKATRYIRLAGARDVIVPESARGSDKRNT